VLQESTVATEGHQSVVALTVRRRRAQIRRLLDALRGPRLHVIARHAPPRRVVL
jgi:hypothetical protein